MTRNEEYLIANTSFVESRIVDGVFTDLLRTNLENSFKKEGADFKERVGKIHENAQELFIKEKNLVSNPNKPNNNILIVGKVQSGKTSNILMNIAVCFDNGFDLAIYFGGVDNVLVDQTYERVSKVFGGTDDQAGVGIQIFDASKKLKVSSSEEFLDFKQNNVKIIIVCMKQKKHLEEVYKFLNKLGSSINQFKTLIIDDEGDQASLNTQFKKDRESSIYKEILKLKELLNNPLYLSLTATPEALVFSPETSSLKPDDVFVIEPGKGYTGSDIFHSDTSELTLSLVEEEDQEMLKSGYMPKAIKIAILYYILASAIIVKGNIKRKTQMIIHAEKEVFIHDEVAKLVENFLSPFKKAIEVNNQEIIEELYLELSEIYNDRKFLTQEIRNKFPFDDALKEKIKIVCKKIFVLKHNGKNRDDISSSAYKDHKIIVGADLLQRGVTFSELIVTYFTRWPKNTFNIDTTSQRERRLGYREDIIDFCRVFCTESIKNYCAKLTDVENELRVTLKEIDSGEKNIDDVVVDIPDEKMNPSRQNVISVKRQTFGSKWKKQREMIPFTAKNTYISANVVFDNLIAKKYKWDSTSKGRTKNDGVVTAYYAYVSYEDIERLILECESFSRETLIGVKDTLSYIKSVGKFVVITFFNPNEFNNGVRSRGVDSNWEISYLFQGQAKVKETGEVIYQGDSKVIIDKDAVNIQVSRVTVKKDNKYFSEYNGTYQYMYAIYIPGTYNVFTRVGGSGQ